MDITARNWEGLLLSWGLPIMTYSYAPCRHDDEFLQEHSGLARKVKNPHPLANSARRVGHPAILQGVWPYCLASLCGFFCVLNCVHKIASGCDVWHGCLPFENVAERNITAEPGLGCFVILLQFSAVQ